MKTEIKETKNNFKPFNFIIHIETLEQAKVLESVFGATCEKTNPGCCEIYDTLSDYLDENYE